MIRTTIFSRRGRGRGLVSNACVADHDSHTAQGFVGTFACGEHC